jgi:ribosomal protein S18 acetylase RimI-like enzyme
MLSDEGFTALISINEVTDEADRKVATFTCGNDGLDSFLKEHSRDLHSDHLGHTHLIFHDDFPGLVGFVTLSCDSIPLKTSEVGELGLKYQLGLNAYPAIKIGRLAVHQELQSSGIGQRILDLIIGDIVSANAIAAARILITDAVNDERVIRFYRKYGFEESYWAVDQARNHSKGRERGTIKMIRDIYY